jgi:hypothetical protein
MPACPGELALRHELGDQRVSLVLAPRGLGSHRGLVFPAECAGPGLCDARGFLGKREPALSLVEVTPRSRSAGMTTRATNEIPRQPPHRHPEHHPDNRPDPGHVGDRRDPHERRRC